MAAATALDPRVEVFDLAVEMWWRIIGSLDAEDAADALVGHYRESSDRVMPADIVRRAREARRARAEAIPPNDEVMADAPRRFVAGDWVRALQARRAAMIDDRVSLEEARRRYPVPELPAITGSTVPGDPA